MKALDLETFKRFDSFCVLICFSAEGASDFMLYTFLDLVLERKRM
jgi:hypothetical protein